MDNVSFAIGIARAMGSNRNSHPSGGLSCVAPLLFSRVLGHPSDPYRTPFQCLGKLSDITSESLSDIHRNRCPIWIGTSVRFESESVSDMHRNTHNPLQVTYKIAPTCARCNAAQPVPRVRELQCLQEF